MGITLKEIAQGLLRGELPLLAETELKAERLKVCEGCPQFKQLARQCDLCGCFMDIKTKLLEASCPIDRW
jgi:hypothetical protein